MDDHVRFVDKRSWKDKEGARTAVDEEPKVHGEAEGEGEAAPLPVPEHLHRLWLALGLDDE